MCDQSLTIINVYICVILSTGNNSAL